MKGLFISAIFLLLAMQVMAQQGVAIGTDSVDTQAILEVSANDKGILIPRMTTAERDSNITGLDLTDEGLLIFNATDTLFNYWNGVAWIPFPTAASGIDDDWYIGLGVVSPASINDNIWTNGHVGIGLNNPAYSLDVNGDARIFGNDIYSGPLGTGSFYIRSAFGVAIELNDYGGTTGGYFRIKSDTDQNLFRVNNNGDATLDGDFTITDGGNDLIFKDEGDANIIVDHTSRDTATLDIEADSDIDIVLDRDNNGTSAEFAVKRNDDGSAAVNKLFTVSENFSPMVYPYGTASGTTGGLRFRELEAKGSNYIGLRAADSLDANYNLTLPDTDGSAGELLQTDGTGILSWIDPSALPGGTGSDTDWSISGSHVYKTVGTATIGTSTLAGWPLNIVNSSSRRSLNIAHTFSGTQATDALYIINTNNAASSIAGIRGIYTQAEKLATSASTGSVEGGYFWGIDRYAGSDTSHAYGLQSLGYKYGGSGGDAYGIRAEAFNQTGNNAYGIFATTGVSGATRWAGWFSGDVKITGTLDNPSDAKLKRNIRPLETSLNKILGLKVSSYEFRNEEFGFMNLPEGPQTGFLSKDLKTLFPHLVKVSTHPSPSKESVEAGINQPHEPVEYEGVNYIGLIPHLVRSIQEQQVIIEALKHRIEVLESE